MHASALENLQKCIDRYLGEEFFDESHRVVVDVGSADLDGSSRQLFKPFACEYLGFDRQSGPGVDIVLDDSYHIPRLDESADIVICGQAFAHCEFFSMAFAEMVRVLSPRGYLFLIAPSEDPTHRHPVDCCRFDPDAYIALAKFSRCELVAVWRDERGPWRELVGVFSKDPAAAGRVVQRPRFQTQNKLPDEDDPAANATSGSAPYLNVLRMIHKVARPRSYLEIGVYRGHSLSLAKCPSVAVDPDPDRSLSLRDNCVLFQKASDEFFEFDAKDALRMRPDFVFIDGMHRFEFVLRDFMNVERYAHAATVVVIDDIFPNRPEQALRKRRTGPWTGDVWKLDQCLAQHRPDLHLIHLDSWPTGLLLVLGLDPSNRYLWEHYNSIVAGYRDPQFSTPPEAVIRRHGALHPNSSALRALMGSVAAIRDNRAAAQMTTAAVRDFLSRAGGRLDNTLASIRSWTDGVAAIPCRVTGKVLKLLSKRVRFWRVLSKVWSSVLKMRRHEIYVPKMSVRTGTYFPDRDQPVLSAEALDVVRRFHDLYYRRWLKHGADTINLSWFGHRVYKCPLDLWIYQELLVRARPDVLIETGTKFGGSALYMAMIFDLLDHGRVITIDMEPQKGRPPHPRIAYLTGSSTDPSIVAEVKRRVNGERAIVVLDSDHRAKHVFEEILAYKSLVQVGDYLIVEDTNVNGHPTFSDHGPGPMEAVEKFLSENGEFEVDERCERFLMTLNPKGYLVRKKPAPAGNLRPVQKE